MSSHFIPPDLSRRSLRVLAGFVYALAIVAGAASADSVVTTSGKSVLGTTNWSDGGLVMRPAGSTASITIPIAEVALATFDPPPAAKAPLASTRPVDWSPFDIGQKIQAGRAVLGHGPTDAGLITLFDTSIGFRSRKKGFDNFFLYGQKVRGDLTLIARLRTTEDAKSARAGLVVRTSEAVDAPMAMVGRSPEGESTLYRRSTEKTDAEDSAHSPHRIAGATWLRFSRQGNTFTSHESADGKAWTLIGSCEITMEEEVYVGLAAYSGNNGREGRTVFDQVSLAAERAPGAARRTPRGIVTRGGSFLAGEVTAIDDAKVRMTLGDGSRRDIAVANVARCILNPLLPTQDEKLRTFGTGVMLSNGDYLAGEFKGMEEGRVRVTSVLFGAKVIDAGREASAVVLRPADPTSAPCAFEVTLADHSLLRATAISGAQGSVKVVDAMAGEMIIKSGDVREIKRVPGQR